MGLHVRFYNPVTHLLYSQHDVETDDPKEAVNEALSEAGDGARGHDVAVMHSDGSDAQGVSQVATKAQIAAQVAQLQQQLADLPSDEADDAVTVGGPRVNAPFSAQTPGVIPGR